MKKNLTEIVFILDRSGSMSGLEADTIGGFNSMIEKQRKADGEALVSTVLFDNISARWRLTAISSRWTTLSRRSSLPLSAVLRQISIRFAAASTQREISTRMMSPS